MKEWRERDRLKGHVDQTHLLVQLLHTHEVQGLDPVEWQRERERKRERERERERGRERELQTASRQLEQTKFISIQNLSLTSVQWER